MKKLTVCYMCDYSVDSEGSAIVHVEPLTQMGLLSQGRLETTVCYDCFRKSYKHLVSNLKAMARRLKTEFDVADVGEE